MPIQTGQFQSALFPGILKFWGDGYRAKPEIYSKVFEVTRSKKNYEDDQQFLGYGLIPVKAEGAALYYASTNEGRKKRYVWTSYAQGFTVSRELIEDELYGIIGKLSKALGTSARHTVEYIAANVLNRAFDTNYVGVDNLPLCHTAHTSAGSGATMSNRLATDSDLSATALEAIFTQTANQVDDNGIRMALTPQKLIIPRGLAITAKQLIESPDHPETPNRSINPFHGELDIIVWDYLTDPDAWFCQNDCENGLMFFWRNMWEMAQDNDFDTLGKKYRLWGRFGLGWTDFRQIIGTPGA